MTISHYILIWWEMHATPLLKCYRLYWESISMSFIQSLYLKCCLWLCCLPLLIWSTSVQKKGHCVFATSPLVNPVIPMNFGVVSQHLAILWEIKRRTTFAWSSADSCLLTERPWWIQRLVQPLICLISVVGLSVHFHWALWFRYAVPCRDSCCSGVLWCASQISPGPTPTPSVHCTSSLPHR